MEEESFIDAFGDVPTDLAGDYSQLYIFHAEDFGAWCRRVRDAHEREVDGGVAGMTDAQLADHGLCRIGSAAMWDELRDMTDRELSEEHGLVRLPTDADGEYIHIGDVMEWCDSGETLTVEGIGRDVLFYIDGGNAEWTAARNKRHRHAPTVEEERPDSLDRIADELEKWCDRVDVDGDACGKPRDLVERIRRLAKDEKAQ